MTKINGNVYKNIGKKFLKKGINLRITNIPDSSFWKRGYYLQLDANNEWIKKLLYPYSRGYSDDYLDRMSMFKVKECEETIHPHGDIDIVKFYEDMYDDIETYRAFI
jgi:hypothetical protein